MNETNRDRRHLLALALVPLLVALAAAPLGSACSSNPTGKPRPDAGPACQPGLSTCPQGTVCNNGNCKQTCASDGTGCATDQYCEGTAAPRLVCAAKTLTPCAVDQDCPLPQFCRSGLCLSIELKADGGSQGCALTGPDDGCAPEALCYQQQLATGAVVNNCIGLPACGQDGTCPVGDQGSVCNDLPDGGQIFPKKNRVCLFRLCVDNSNCPPTAGCFHFDAGESMGECNFGTPGSPCYTAADCFNATTCILADGGVPDGGALGFCY